MIEEVMLLLYLDQYLIRDLHATILDGYIESETVRYSVENENCNSIRFEIENGIEKNPEDKITCEKECEAEFSVSDKKEHKKDIEHKRIYFAAGDDSVSSIKFFYSSWNKMKEMQLTKNIDKIFCNKLCIGNHCRAGEFVDFHAELTPVSLSGYVTKLIDIIEAYTPEKLDEIIEGYVKKCKNSKDSKGAKDIRNTHSYNNCETNNYETNNYDTNNYDTNNSIEVMDNQDDDNLYINSVRKADCNLNITGNYNFNIILRLLTQLQKDLNNGGTEDFIVDAQSYSIIINVCSKEFNERHLHIYDNCSCKCRIWGKVCKIIDDSDSIKLLRKTGQVDYYESLLNAFQPYFNCLRNNEILLPKRPPLEIQGPTIIVKALSINL